MGATHATRKQPTMPCRSYCGQGIRSTRARTSIHLLHRETDLERYLIVRDLAVLHVAPRLHDLEPSQMANSLVGTADRGADGILDASLGRAHELYDFVDMVLHGGLLAL